MKQRVSLKLLILFGITCTTFMLAGSRLHAADVIENKSSTFSAQLNNRTDSTSNDSAIAEKIRAQRAAIDARDNRNTATAQIKSSATQNSCDNDLRKCINNTCGANYKKCETDSDTTFSDKLNACRKNTTCTAHEFTLFTNEIKEDKKQAISLALYNDVLDCGNSYNDCIIQQCGPKFNKCLAKSAGDKAINACKTIAQNCTEADSGLSGRVGNVFGIVRVDAEKQIKTDEAKLQSLRDQMRNSCRTLGALFDDRSLDCVFTANFFAGDDKTHPMASKKLYAGSLFDCTPDWFGIDITTFKENAYRATRAQSAASAAMLGSGVGTAVGALTSGAISRAIDTKKAKDALEKACEDKGQVLKDGKCVNKEPGDNNDDEDDEESLTPKQKCESEASGGTWNETTKKCDCPSDKEPDGDACVDQKKKTKCLQNGGKKYILGKCICENDIFEFDGEKCVESADKKAKQEEKNKKAETKEASKKCTDSGGTFDKNANTCSCDDKKGLKLTTSKDECTCEDHWKEYSKKDKMCIHKTNVPCPEIAKYDKIKGCACPEGYNTWYGIGGAKPFDCKPNNEQTCKTANGTWTKEGCMCGDTAWSYGDACSKKTPKSSSATDPNDIMALCTTKYKGKYDSVKNECTCPATDDGKCEQWKQSLKPDMDAVKCFASGGRMIGNSCIKTK